MSRQVHIVAFCYSVSRAIGKEDSWKIVITVGFQTIMSSHIMGRTSGAEDEEKKKKKKKKRKEKKTREKATGRLYEGFQV